jgi:hypothetical protein
MATMPTDGASQHDLYILRLAEARRMTALFTDMFLGIVDLADVDPDHEQLNVGVGF